MGLNERAQAAAAAKMAAEHAAAAAASAAATARKHRNDRNRIEHVQGHLCKWQASMGLSASESTFSVYFTQEPRQEWDEDNCSYTAAELLAMICRIEDHDYLGMISFMPDDEYRNGKVFNERECELVQDRHKPKDRPVSVMVLIADPERKGRWGWGWTHHKFPGFVGRPANTLLEIGEALEEERRYLDTIEHPQHIPEDPEPDPINPATVNGATNQPEPRCSPSHIRNFEVDGSGATLIICLHCHLPPSQEE